MPSVRDWVRAETRKQAENAKYVIVRTATRDGDTDVYNSFTRKLRNKLGRLNVAGAYGWGADVSEAVFVRGASLARVAEILTPAWIAENGVRVEACEDRARFGIDSAEGAFEKHEAREAKAAKKVKKP